AVQIDSALRTRTTLDEKRKVAFPVVQFPGINPGKGNVKEKPLIISRHAVKANVDIATPPQLTTFRRMRIVIEHTTLIFDVDIHVGRPGQTRLTHILESQRHGITRAQPCDLPSNFIEEERA